uniref:restriction endonuclease subunit S n=1 Tax=Vaginimicrobium propionicum TaxID=1871034 RepID=UPI000970DEAB|nr:restriction endonuclease subunit S [Vaginimicrobium propionicum]
MARKKAMPIIEDFNNIPEEALVPEREQPYTIPENWKWVRLGSIAIASKKKVDTFSDEQRYLGLENLASGGGLLGISSARDLKSPKSVFTSGHILYGRLRPYLDKHVVVSFDGICSTDIVVYCPTSAINAHYFNHWLSTSTFRSAAVEHSKGINLPRVSEATLAQFAIPLPPLAEQERIVAYLDENLGKINNVCGKLQDFLAGAEERKERLIQAGVSGHLTEDWREKHDSLSAELTSRTLKNFGSRHKETVRQSPPRIPDFDNIPTIEHPYTIPENWRWVRLGSVCEINPPKTDTSSIPPDTDVSFIPMAAVSDVTGRVENVEVRQLRQVSKGYTSFSTGDVLFAKITPCMENGKAAIVPALINGIGYGSTEFFVLRPSDALKTRLLHTFVRQKSFRARAKKVMAGAVGQQRVPKHFLQQSPLPLPPLAEQEEMVRVLDNALNSLADADSRARESLDKLNLVKQQLVSAALSGRLT